MGAQSVAQALVQRHAPELGVVGRPPAERKRERETERKRERERGQQRDGRERTAERGERKRTEG